MAVEHVENGQDGMRLLLINYEYPPVGGGAANATREIARALVNLGHRVHVLTAAYNRRHVGANDDGVNVIAAPAIRHHPDRANIFEMASFALGASCIVRKVIRDQQIDGSVAFFSIPSGPIAWWGQRGTKTPYVVALRGGDVPGNEPKIHFFHSVLQPLRRIVLRNAKAVFANSTKLKEASERADPVSVSVIPNGVNREFWHPGAKRMDPPPWKLLYVGRFQTQKNLPWLLTQLTEWVRGRQREDWELHLVGDGPQREELLAQARQSGINNRLHWHGWLSRENLRVLYQQSHILIHPARYEGMPNAILEAAACGLKILVSSDAATPELTSMISELSIYNSASGNSFANALDLVLKQYNSSSSPYTGNIADWTMTANQILKLFDK